MRSIAELFKGRDDVHGYYGLLGTKPTDRGKRTGEAETKREPVTADLWQLHLTGKQRLGIVPIMRDATCWWFCIDVDHYQETGLHEEIAARIKELNLPLVMTRSKSGGAHLWCFLTSPMKAAEAIAAALNFKKRLALPDEHVDIFPAQANADDVGNWMNMPYFGDLCHATGEDGGSELTLREFELLANAKAVPPGDLGVASKKSGKTKRRKGGDYELPPCIEHVMKEGCVPEGFRDNFITHVAIVFKRAYPDDWTEKVQEFNQEYCDPPLDKGAVRKTINSVKAKDFGYMCDKVSAIYCDKSLCKSRDFGLKGPDNNNLEVDSIEIIEGEQPIYRLSMYGKKFTVDLDTMFNYQLFRKAVMGATRKVLTNMKNDEWAVICQGLLDLAHIHDAAPDTQMGERVVQNFRRFASGATTESLDAALLRGLPYYSDVNNHIVFRGDDFMQLVDRNLKLSREMTWVHMQQAGCVQNLYTVGEKKEKLWCFVVSGDLWFDPNEGERA